MASQQLAGAAVLALSGCLALGMLLSYAAPSGQQLYTAVGVTPSVATTATAPVVTRLSVPRHQVAAEASYTEAPHFESVTAPHFQYQQSGGVVTMLGLMAVPVVALIGYLAGRQSASKTLTPLDLSVHNYGSYAMLATAGSEADVEVGDIADLEEVGEEEEEAEPEKKPVVVEQSYAKIIANIEKQFLKDDIPTMYPGDTVVVGVRIREGEKERIQKYQGIIIAINNAGLHKAITVRAVLQGVGVERVFPVHAPEVASIEVLKRGKVRRAKLYYLRGRTGKAARVKERFDRPLPGKEKKVAK